MIPGRATPFPRASLATPHYLASGAGAAVLARGGNAIDAIIAANLALGVVAPYYCGYGGDIFAIVWDGELHGYLGSGRSPAAATIAAVRDALGETPLLIGPHAVTVPGAIAGWFELLDRWGTMSFGELATDAIRYARDGFTVTPLAGAAAQGYTRFYRDFPEWQAVYGGLGVGDHLVQAPLARLIELLAVDGPDAYYRGPVATDVVDALARYGGFMSTDDFASHAGRWDAPLRARYRDVEIAELPSHPWFIATLFDTYFAFLTFYCWVAYKETSNGARVIWLIAILLLGNIAMAIYMLRVLCKVPTDADMKTILLRQP